MVSTGALASGSGETARPGGTAGKVAQLAHFEALSPDIALSSLIDIWATEQSETQGCIAACPVKLGSDNNRINNRATRR
ncbi:hypothetical protein HCU01_39040 [Halomonas cupida]|uniref:Uncharacterized protein n=1 Tax=Halomonas cupida TaxID=44933 RepID=A0ABQ0WJK7_9GAMM|nr:hypothetical protein HCU01_39040 [Halomonas cupida]